MQSLSSGNQDVAKAKQAFHSLGFRHLKEDIFADRKYGISIKNFDNEVQTLAKTYKLPDNVVGMLKRGKVAERNSMYMKEFKYQLGNGKVMYGLFATMRKDNTIDLAYSLFQVSFQLNPEKIEHVRKKKKKFLGINLGTKKKKWVEYRARSLSEEQVNSYVSYFRSQAAIGYQNKFRHDEL